MPALRLLLIDDSADDAAGLVRTIELGGYDVESERVAAAATLSTALDRQPWDLRPKLPGQRT